ncbi:hypothetical protein GOP47_0009889 [Adiantum capillus-veneris]|uniref:UBA domain-containing protein n=1 Tax=Adiantum capillus-veneris TaxID=13818 RepID=A0A9D4UYA7_ADICA|nr:hypothetical protein GOP47_0009889 [Adiantum capillus-veneris]
MSPSKKGPRDCKTSARQAASSGLGANAYNPSSGTFHTLETLNPDSEAGYLNGRFKSIDETDDTASSHGGADMDSMSNNGSCSGESEDQLHSGAKDKAPLGKSGTVGGADKRDKTRGKNERKHQRQKERRAKEMREKCNGYLMSRKLEGLAQKLVAMGFSHERATMALIVNSGHVEQSIAWLLEGAEGQVQEDWSLSGSLKIDITEELGKLLEIEKSHKYSRLDIERAIISCEGDLEKALESLRARNITADIEEECKIESRIMGAERPASLPALFDSPQPRGNATVQPFHQTGKVRVAVPSFEGRPAVDPCVSIEGRPKNSIRTQLSNSQSLGSGVERRLIPQSVPVPRVPYMPSSYTPISSAETGLVFGFGAPDPRLLFAGSIEDPFRSAPVKESSHTEHFQSPLQLKSQPIVATKNNPKTSPSFSPSSWTSSKGLTEVGSPSSVLHVHDDVRMKGLASIQHAPEGSEMGPGDLADRISLLSPIRGESQRSFNGVGRGLPYKIATAASSLPATTQSGSPSGISCGLFTGWGEKISQPIDWSTGGFGHCDYRNIDWSMNVTRATTSQGSSNWPNFPTHQMKTSNQWDFEGERRYKIGGRAQAGFPTDLSCSGLPGGGMEEKISLDFRNSSAHEWTTPFAGKPLFNIPQAVLSPFL